MQITYIGTKDRKADNVAGTKLVWTPGQSHEVADPVACAKLLHHSGVWALTPASETKTYPDGTTATGPAPLPEQSPAADAPADLTVDEVREALKARGVKFHPNTGEQKLRAMLKEA